MGKIAALGGSSPDLAIFGANAVLSSLVPVLGFAFGRIAGLPPARAVIGAMLVVIDPVSVRFAATESYFVPILVLGLGASTAIAAAVRTSARSRTNAALLLVSAALLAAQASRIHPAAWATLAICPLAALCGGATTDATRDNEGCVAARVRVVWAVLAGGAIAIAVLATSAGWIAAASRDAARHGAGLSGDFGAPVVFVLLALVFAIARARHWTLVVVAGFTLALDASLRVVYGQSEAWQACFDRLFVPIPALAAAALLPEPLLATRRRRLAGIASAVAIAVQGWQLVRTPTTEQVEYRWLRGELARFDRECRVASMRRVGKRVAYLPRYVMQPPPNPDRAPSRWFGVESRAALSSAARHGRCVVWFHGSLCESPDGRAACDSIESDVEIHEISAIEIDAVPSYEGLGYDVPRVRVALYRVEP